MASPKSETYHPLPSLTYHIHHPQTYVVLPVYNNSGHRRPGGQCRLITTVCLLLLALAVYIIWPANPALNIVRLKLHHVEIHTVPLITVDISLALSVKVRNVDLYSMNYGSVYVAVAYRGRDLGHVISEGGHVRARRSSFVDAVVVFNGVEILYDVVDLIKDLARGTVPFDTVTEVKGQIGLFFFRIPVEAKVSCEVDVNTNNQTIAHQKCYHE